MENDDMKRIKKLTKLKAKIKKLQKLKKEARNLKRQIGDFIYSGT
jgi:hypothetical protein